MDKVNFLGKPDFPLSINSLNNMQNMIYLVATLSAMGGNDYILSGCNEVQAGEISEGYIVVNGEILRFKGGAKKDKFTIRTTRKDLMAFGVEYPEAYIFRDAEFSENGEFIWSDYQQINTIQGLQKQINNIKGDALGMVKEWAGKPSEIPKDYMLCDGRDLAIDDYPELYKTIGVMYGGDGLTSFKLPNAGGRVSVCYTGMGDYALQGNKGGAESVSLEVENLAKHKHIMPWGENPSTAWNPQWGYAPPPYNQDMRGSNSNDGDNSWAYSSDVGEGKPHENRMPYIVFAKIIKVRE